VTSARGEVASMAPASSVIWLAPSGSDRCRECVYLLKLELAGTPPVGQVVCADSHLEAEFDFAW
jgi:hypothetical protein